MFQIEFKIMFWVISALLGSVRDLNYGQPQSNIILDSLVYIWSSNSDWKHIDYYWTKFITPWWYVVFCENKRWMEFTFQFCCCFGPCGVASEHKWNSTFFSINLTLPVTASVTGWAGETWLATQPCLQVLSSVSINLLLCTAEDGTRLLWNI